MAGLLPILLLFPLMYFMLIRPQQKRVREQQAMLSAVAEGDEIVTTAGLYGFVTAIDGDVLWLEIADGVEVRVAKAAIARRLPPAVSESDADEAPAKTDASDADGDPGRDASTDEAR